MMFFNRYKFVFLFILFLINGLHSFAEEQKLNLIPLPKHVEWGEYDDTFELPRKYKVYLQEKDDRRVVDDIARFMRKLESATSKKGRFSNRAHADIRFIKDSLMHEEEYKLRVTKEFVEINYATSHGCYYALQTLAKLMPSHVILGKLDAEVEDYSIPCLTIHDEPRFPYRGFMLDVSRHFFSVSHIKKILDIMSIYKMNKFHWHLTDDQGWRIEIKKYPLLTKIGSVSDDMLMNDEHRTKYMNGKPYGPYFYTQEQVSEVVAYAHERHIDVIPEVDMPGHMVAALAAYPEFSCNPHIRQKVWTKNDGLSRDILNVANPQAMNFARDVVDELCQLFPGPDIHIGGDECPTDDWENNEACNQLLHELGYTSHRALQSWLIKELAMVASKHHKGIYIWNEGITAEGVDISPLKEYKIKVMCWVGAQAAARKTTKHGLDAVITPIGPYYINRKQWDSSDEPYAAGSGNDSLQVTYQYEPVPFDIDSTMASHYKGVQATFWTEFVSTDSYQEYLMLPRLIAVAETGWTDKPKKDFKDFVRRLNADRKMLDLGGYNYGKHYIYK